jgi:hypothetical protein
MNKDDPYGSWEDYLTELAEYWEIQMHERRECDEECSICAETDDRIRKV